jgi:hypothetical protein
MKAPVARMPSKHKLTATSFEALSTAEKNRILKEIEAQTPEQRLAESRPLNAKERAGWNAFVRKARQHRAGKNGVERVSIDVEQSLLREADRYAKRHKLNRSELFVQGVKRLIGELEG